MDRRIVSAVQKFYPQGIPATEIERALSLVADLLGPTAPAPIKAPPPPPPKVAPVAVAAKRPRGRPKKPRAAAASGPNPKTLESVRQFLNLGPATAQDIQNALHLKEGEVSTLLATLGAKPIGTVELEDGALMHTYGFAATGGAS